MGTFEVTTPLYLCMYVPEFTTQSLLRFRPELTTSAVAVLAGEPPFEKVCSINVHAARLGVTAGMTRVELERFSRLHVLRRSEQEERAARSVLLEAAGAFTPRIEVQPSFGSAFVVVLDMTGTARIFGPPQQAANKITKSIAALNFYAQFAVSMNLHAATCVVPSARKGPIVLSFGHEAEHLRELPVCMLNLSPKQADIFSLWGLRTMGELADISEVELVVRLGEEGKKLHLLSRGEYPHLFIPEEPVFLLEELFAFNSPVDQLDSLLFVLSPMLDQLLARARSRALAIANVTLKLALDGGGEYVRTIKPALPIVQCDVLLKLMLLDLQIHSPSAAVMTVLIRAEPGHLSKVQLGLFAPQLPESLRLDITLARIAAIVGEERVGRARLKDSHRPDSFVMERFSIHSASLKHRPPIRAAVSLRRFRPPIILFVQQDGQSLTAFSLRGKRYVVEKACGPWRVSGNWWSTDVWAHEEWDVQAAANETDKLLCLLTRDLLHHRWQLEALYD